MSTHTHLPRLKTGRHSKYAQTVHAQKAFQKGLKGLFDHSAIIYKIEISVGAFVYTGCLVYLRCCCLAPIFSTNDACRHLRDSQGGNAAQCAERSNMRHA